MRFEIITIILIIGLILMFGLLLDFNISKAIITGVVFGIFPYLIYQEINNRIEMQKEEQFIRFSLDLMDLLKSGLSLPLSLKQLENNDYGVINELLKNLSARIDWGISIEDSLMEFGEESNNSTIRRTIKSLIDIYKSGGNLEKGLEAVINSLVEVRKIKESKRAEMHENIIDSYLVFMFFLGIIFTFQVFLLPFLSISLPGQTSTINTNYITNLMYNLSIIQGIFAGLAMGKMYNDSYRAGAKYILIFLIATLILFDIIIPITPKGSFLINI
ncbi:archaeal flagellar protein FlaJ [Nanobdella aerobiophila]|uniref:Archaeal flagellar protein FlaJ n=1 Tax=Nanobdella aerobiophila TaxID=2586965 RepID=A0A915T0B8_9ARCH|nr:type II secretion system F family protein [Nanobdella aerobiophila]BBL45874.1 archaeal flagellar protein FlaJ [Nanobdella aerobiophila]